MSSTPSYKDMPLWQRSMQLAVEICQLCLQLPNSNRLILTTNLQEAAVAIPTLLARGSKAGKRGFLNALGSASQQAAELETLIILMQNIYNDAGIAALHEKTLQLQQALATMSLRLAGGADDTPQRPRNI